MQLLKHLIDEVDGVSAIVAIPALAAAEEHDILDELLTRAASMKENERTAVLTMIARYAPHNHLAQLLAAAQELAEPLRARVLVQLLPELSEEQRTAAVDEIARFVLTHASTDPQEINHACVAAAAIAPRLPVRRRRRMIEHSLGALLRLGLDLPGRRSALAALVPWLTERMALRALDASLLRIDDVPLLRAISGRIRPRRLQTVFNRVARLVSVDSRLSFLAALTTILPRRAAAELDVLDFEINTLFRDVGLSGRLRLLEMKDGEADNARAFVEQARDLPPHERPRWLREAAPWLRGEPLAEALHMTIRAADSGEADHLLGHLHPHVASFVANRIADRLRKALPDDPRIGCSVLLPGADDTERARVIRRYLDRAAALVPHADDDVLRRMEAHIEAVAPHLSVAEWHRALAIVRSIAETGKFSTRSRSKALAALARSLPREKTENLLATALALDDPASRDSVLAAAVHRVDERQLADLVRRAMSDGVTPGGEAGRVELLSALAQRRSSLRRELVAKAFDTLGPGPDLTASLRHLGPCLRNDEIDRGMRIAEQAGEPEDVVAAMCAVLEGGHATSRPDLVARCVDLAVSAPLCTMGDPALRTLDTRRVALLAVAPVASGAARAKAIDAAIALPALFSEKPEPRLNMVTLLAAFLREPAPQRLHVAARALLCDYLFTLIDEKRSFVLTLVARNDLLVPPLLSRHASTRIAEHVLDICYGWTWR
jgi:hypothetical protein